MPTFLLLRPDGKCQLSNNNLIQKGLDIVGLPLLKLAPDTEGMEAFPSQLQALRPDAVVIVTSTFAADQAKAAMGDTPWPSELTYLAVGKTTAEKLQQQEIKTIYPQDQRSEGLLAMPELADIKGRQVLIIKGHNGRETLAEQLQSQGAELTQACLYRRVTIDTPKPTTPWQPEDIHCIIATSGELLEQAFNLYAHNWLKAVTWIVVSPRLEKQARDKGISNIVVSNGADDEALFNAANTFLEHHMAESTEQKLEQLEKSIDTGKTSAEPKASEPTQKTNENKLLLWLLGLFNLLFISMVVAGGYWAWQQWQPWQQQQLSAQQEIQQLANRLQQDNQALKQQLSAQKQSQAQNTDALADLIEQNRQGVAQLAGRRSSDWLLAEADYLVRMAGRKVWLEQDINTAISLMIEADQRIQDMAEPSLLPVREQIARDIQTLKQITKVDNTTLALQLAGLISLSERLSLAMVKLPEPSEGNQDLALSNSASDWKDNLAKTWHSLVDDFIEVRRRTDTIKPLMTEKQQWLARQQLQHYLLQAQSAILQHKSALFISALQQAKQLLTDEFDTSVYQVEQFQRDLDELLATDVSQALPQQLESSQTLKDAIQQRLQQAYSNLGIQS